MAEELLQAVLEGQAEIREELRAIRGAPAAPNPPVPATGDERVSES